MHKILKSILLLAVFLNFGSSVSACTVFNATVDNITIAGRNMDWYTQENFVAFLPSNEEKYGRVYFGWNNYPSWYQGGMNDQGVMFAYLAAPYLRVTGSIFKPIYYGNYGNLMEKCMEECSSVEEVLDVFSQYNLKFLENCQVIVVDHYGDSVIIEGDNIIIKNDYDYYQVVTNFRHSHPLLGGYPCWRYEKAVEMLEEMTFFSVDYFTEICNATHQEGNYPTQWSIIYDLENYDIYLYHYHDYSDVVVFNLIQELELGAHVYSIPSLFDPSNNHRPGKPPRPLGPENGRIRDKIRFTFGPSVDPDGDDIYYLIDWDDGTNSSWFGPFNSGEICEASHRWTKQQIYNVKVKTKDIHGAESFWSDPLFISIPKSKQILYFWLYDFLENHNFLQFIFRQILDFSILLE